MSQLSQWIALSALAYGLVILCIVLTYWTSQVAEGFFEFPVRVYRLLLAAYPAAFRQEYSDAMMQLFRDQARDAYRRRGVLGLAAMWLRTLADFTISVIRQHRDRPVQVSSESVLLRDFLHKWRRLGSEALSVTVFSAWYGWHLLRLYFRRSTLVWATLTTIAFGLWTTSFFDSLNWMRGPLARVDIGGGTVQIWHVYEVGQPLSEEQWQHYIHTWSESNPGVAERFESLARPWEFSFFSDIPSGTVVQSRTIEDGPARGRRRIVRTEPVLTRPCKSWRLRFPFGILPVLMLGWTIRVYLRQKAGSVAAVQSA